MGALDSVVDDVGSRFGIGTSSAGSLLSGLLSLITQQSSGLGRFLDRFRNVGMGNLVSSWFGGETKPIPPANVETALGKDAIGAIASKANLSFATAASAIGFMLPTLVQRLAPGGAIPSHLPPEITSYITGPTAAIASGARHAVATVEGAARRSDIRRFLWPLLAILAIVLVGTWIWNRVGANRTVFDVEEQARMATQRATAALAALRPGFSAGDLVGVLNLDIINFPSGSAEIPADNYDFLNKAAVAINAAPSGTVIEIAGHTDNSGNSLSNQQLSEQRAQAVMNYLTKQGVDPAVLVVKGYGDTRPLTTNDTEEGRFHNRRIEFTAVK